MLLVVALFLIPVIIWNWQHGFPTSHFLVHRGALDERMRLRPLEVLSFLGQQAGVISPVLFLGLLAAVFWPGFAPNSRVQTGYLLTLFLPLFLVYLLLSFQKASQANWAAAAYVSGLILVAAKWCQAVAYLSLGQVGRFRRVGDRFSRDRAPARNLLAAFAWSSRSARSRPRIPGFGGSGQCITN